MGHYCSFVVRLWVGDDDNIRRGYIQHSSSQESMHFLTFDQMTAFMAEYLNRRPNHINEHEEEDSLRKTPLNTETINE